MNEHLVVGYGEIGKGLVKVLNPIYEVVIYDTKLYTTLDISSLSLSTLHICIPGDLKEFVKIVSEYISLLCPKLTIIHATVPVGTTREIEERTKSLIVHSPVRGLHPDLDLGIKTYTKYIGYNNGEAARLAEKVYTKAKIPFKRLWKTETTELAKLLSTTRYGVSIAFAQSQHELCETLGLSYKEVVTEWETTYNKGLKELDLEKYVRPVIDPPLGPIGGHCVVPNAKILGDSLQPYLREIIETGGEDE